METPLPLEGTGSLFAVTVVDSEGFSQAGLNASRIMKRKPVRPYTEFHTRNTHAVWPATDASDRLDVDMDEPVDPDGLGGEGNRHCEHGARVGSTTNSNEGGTRRA